MARVAGSAANSSSPSALAGRVALAVRLLAGALAGTARAARTRRVRRTGCWPRARPDAAGAGRPDAAGGLDPAIALRQIRRHDLDVQASHPPRAAGAVLAAPLSAGPAAAGRRRPDRRRSASRRARAPPQAGDARAARRAAHRGAVRRASAGAVGRLLGARQPAAAGAAADELEAFYARWSGSYVEDRLRNDWLLELGKRRDWANFAPRLPALSHERRPRGHLLRAARRSTWPARTCATPALRAPGSRSATPTTAAQLLAAHAGRRRRASAPTTSGSKARLARRSRTARRAARAAAALLGAPRPQARRACSDNPARCLDASAAARVGATRTTSWPRWR
ncbi:MAG: hypothetical protein MZW92_34815 [Comamonadaceae bacterium]|nr:hypothetical protein [Comamonadaceae bacterium]